MRIIAMPSALPQSKKKLQALISALREELRARDEQIQSQRQLLDAREAQIKEHSALIEKLKFELARLKRWRFGKHAETLSAEQLVVNLISIGTITISLLIFSSFQLISVRGLPPR